MKASRVVHSNNTPSTMNLRFPAKKPSKLATRNHRYYYLRRFTCLLIRLKQNTAPEIDLITNNEVKKMPRKTMPKFLNIVNGCDTTPPKLGNNRGEPKNYEPLNLLSNNKMCLIDFNKVFDKVQHHKLF